MISENPEMPDQSAIYLIEIAGMLDVDWSDRLSGMQISVTPQNDQSVTELVGKLNDQAALLGVLNAVYNRGMPIIRVERLTNSRTDDTRHCEIGGSRKREL